MAEGRFDGMGGRRPADKPQGRNAQRKKRQSLTETDQWGCIRIPIDFYYGY